MPHRPTLRIGTRGSALALAQAGQIRALLKKKFPNIRFPFVIVKTTGDEFQSVELFRKNNVGVFTKTIEEKLLQKKVDIAVHSLKDLPTDLPAGLFLAAFPKRLDVCDVLISRNRSALKTLPAGALVGTGSPRRKRQIAMLRPDLKLVDIRGNLDTRVKKVLENKTLDAVVVAKAGLLRIKKYLKYARTISPADVLPAAGQAALGIEIRKGDLFAAKVVSVLNHKNTEKEVLAERRFLKVLQGGCRIPVGIHSKIKHEKLFLKAAVFSTRSRRFIAGEVSGRKEDFEKVGARLAKKLLKGGAKKILQEARSGGLG